MLCVTNDACLKIPGAVSPPADGIRRVEVGNDKASASPPINFYLGVAQQVERSAWVREAAGSDPATLTSFSGVEKQLSRQPHKLEITGASPVSATKQDYDGTAPDYGHSCAAHLKKLIDEVS